MKKILLSLVLILALAGVSQADDTLHVDVDTCDTYWMNFTSISYVITRTAAAANYINSQINNVRVGQVEEGNYWYLREWGMEFDTGLLPDDANLTACTLFAYSLADYTDAGCDFYLCIVQGSYTCPLALTEWDEWEPGVAGSLSTAGLGVDTYISIVFNTDSLSWISKTGITKLTLLSDKFINSVEPGDEESWCWEFRQGYEGFEDYWPYLKIAYTTEAPGVRKLILWRK